MRVIVLYYGDSEGRYASEALAESFRSFGSQCTTVDVSAFSSRIGQAIERTVSFAVSLMNLFRLRRRGASLGAAGLSGSGHLRSFTESAVCDVVITADISSAFMYMRARRGMLRAPAHYFVSVDHSVDPRIKMLRADRYFIPHSSMKRDFTEAGVPAERLCAYGIPVTVSSAVRTEMVPRDGALYLLVAEGKKACFRIADALLSEMQSQDRLKIFCKDSRRLCSAAARKYRGDGRVTVELGIGNPISRYGGVLILASYCPWVTAEMVRNTPIVLYFGVGGIGREYASFFRASGAAACVFSASAAAGRALGLSSSPELRERMYCRQRLAVNQHASEDIARGIIQSRELLGGA